MTEQKGNGIDMHPNDLTRRGERGQVLVVVAGGVTTLLLILGLVLDGGIAFFNRRDGQNVSDIAALAGGKDVASFHRNEPRSGDTWDAISAAVAANGCTSTSSVPCTWQAWYVGAGAAGPVDIQPVADNDAVPSNALGVRVAVNRRPHTYLVGLAGITSWNISNQATAIAWKPRMAPSGHLLPIAFKQDPAGYQPGQVYDITDGKDAPGGFGYISWTGANSAGSLATSICTPDNPEFYLPRQFPGDPGKTNADDVRACLDGWINSGQTVLIPIYDQISGGGNGASYRIIGIASFVLTAREQPAVDNIRGYFVEIYPYTDPVPGGTGSVPPAPTDTTFSLALVR